jgi:arylamine N-acetyltransferase
MMRTAIFTARDNMTLTIQTDEVVDLVQMGQEASPIRLSPGQNAVTVPRGVFKMVSKGRVGVTSDAADLEVVVTPENKGDWPDLTLAQTATAMGTDSKAVAEFLADAKSVSLK